MACFATGPALGMFEVYGRTGPQTLGEGGSVLDARNSVYINLPV